MIDVAEIRPAWVPNDLYPFADRWADIDGHRVHYLDEGAGPPILLLNGNPSWSFGWRDVILRLRERFRCIAPDYPGFGMSREAPGFDFRPSSQSRVVEALVDRLGLDGLIVVAYAWGGPIGLGFAGRRPDLIRGLVIGNTWAWPKGDPVTQLFSRLLGGPIGRRLIQHRNLFVEAALPGGVRLRTLPEAVMNAYRGPFPTPASRRPTAVFPREILASRPFLADIERRLPELSDRPALIVWPTKDVAFGDRERERWEELFPDHRTVLLEGAGHYIQEDAPDEIVTAIQGWRSPPHPESPG